jgi:hypothetical protein
VNPSFNLTIKNNRNTGRVFSKTLRQELDLRKFNLSEAWSKSTFRLISFAFTAWATDHRSRADRLRDPKLLDVGWVEAAVPELVVKQDSITHLTLAENSVYTNKNKDVCVSLIRQVFYSLSLTLRRICFTASQARSPCLSFENAFNSG